MDTNTSIVTGEPRAMAALSDEYIVAGADILQREDITLPRMLLVQSQKGKNSPLPTDFIRHVGEYYNTITGEFRSEIEGILLGIAKQRVAWGRDYEGDNPALCGSDNALYPRNEFIGATVQDTKTGIVHVIDGACAECPFSKFTENEQNSSIPPMCTLVYVYAMLDMENGMPFILRAQRTGIQAARQLNTVAKMMGRVKSVIISAKVTQDDKGTYAVPVFATGQKLTLDIINAAAQIVHDMGNLAERVSAVEPDGAGTNATAMHDEEEIPF
jgi:hypothetical protein